MNIWLFIALLLLTFSAAAPCADADDKKNSPLVAVVRIRSLELLPKISPNDSLCQPTTNKKQAIETICVDNGCGRQVLRLRVEQMVHGVQPRGELVLHTYLGEWCRSQLPLTEPILIVVWDIKGEGDLFDWIPVQQTTSGESFFVPDCGSEFAGVPLQKLIAPIVPAETTVLGNKTETPKQRVKDLVEARIGCLAGDDIVVCGGVTVKSWLQAFLHAQQSAKRH